MLSDNIDESNCDVNDHQLLEKLWHHGVESVRGRASVNRFFEGKALAQDYSVVAIGKAATDMMLGAVDVLGGRLKSGLVLTKYQHLTDEINSFGHITCLESSHPVPDQNSLHAGERLLEFVEAIPEEHQVLMLVSGGASSLVEVLVDGCSLDDLQTLSEWALHSGLNINEINYMRQQISQIKGGKLCRYFNGHNVLCLYISDVPNDNIGVIGSGPLYAKQPLSSLIPATAKQSIDDFLKTVIDVEPSDQLPETIAECEHYVIANNAIAKEAVQQYARDHGYAANIINDPIYTDYRDAADSIFRQLSEADPGIYIWGGEPTVELPDKPGQGGRNQALALLLGTKLKDCADIAVLVGGTDGTDGPTDAAGAIIDGQTYTQAVTAGWQPQQVLDEANAYPCLKAIHCLFSPGPTGTNVMDLIIARVAAKP